MRHRAVDRAYPVGLIMGSIARDAVHRLRCQVLLARRAAAAEPVG